MKMLSKYFLIGAMLTLVACGSSSKEGEGQAEDTTTVVEETEMTEEISPMRAEATISSRSGSSLNGVATFTDLGDGMVTFKLTVENAAPGTHAVHLHVNGDCSAEDASSAGGHWNPSEVDHGKRSVDMQFHAGDIDNLEVGEDSTGVLEMTIKGWSIGGPDSTNILNKAVIVHEKADDFTSQPSGAAGPRAGCGVIEKVE